MNGKGDNRRPAAVKREEFERRWRETFVCRACHDERWVCEQHPDRPFPHDDCGGPGEPCPVCNAGSDVVLHDGSVLRRLERLRP